MRITALAALAGMAFVTATAPANAAWHSYINRIVGFSFEMPGDMKAEKASYNAQMAGQHDATVYRSVDDNIEYKAMVVDLSQRADEGAVLLGEATYVFQDKKKLVMDTFGRVDGLYGRKLTIDNSGSRTLGAFYFVKGHLITLQVTVLPGGDAGTPDMGRFVDSLAFRPDRAESGSIDVK